MPGCLLLAVLAGVQMIRWSIGGLPEQTRFSVSIGLGMPARQAVQFLVPVGIGLWCAAYHRRSQTRGNDAGDSASSF